MPVNENTIRKGLKHRTSILLIHNVRMMSNLEARRHPLHTSTINLFNVRYRWKKVNQHFEERH